MKFIKPYIIGLTFLSLTAFAFAQNYTTDELLSKFKYKINLEEVASLKLKIPKVIEMPLSVDNRAKEFTVFNSTDKVFVPYLIKDNTAFYSNRESVEVENKVLPSLSDDNYSTIERFEVGEGIQSIVNFQIHYDKEIDTGSISIYFAHNVAWPTAITIKYKDENRVEKVALNTTNYTDSIFFPNVKAKEFVVSLAYSQPLEISEIKFSDSSFKQNVSSIRFLSKPNSEYSLYYDTEASVSLPTGEAPNLNSEEDVVRLVGSDLVESNKTFVWFDIDKDSIPNVADNCVGVYNPDQKDEDKNGRGDACDDYDKDGVVNSLDNCIYDPNFSQSDIDKDGIGDACDKEESRFAEKNKWILWASVVAAVIIIGGLGLVVVKDLKKNLKEERD